MLRRLPGVTRGPALLAGAGAGILLGLLVRINATLGAYVGVLEATFVIHLVGTLFALCLLATRLSRAFLLELNRGPRYQLLGGLLGVLMVLLANVTVPHLGVALAVSLFIAADLLLSSLADHTGLFGLPRFRFSARRLLGLLLVMAGVLLLW